MNIVESVSRLKCWSEADWWWCYWVDGWWLAVRYAIHMNGTHCAFARHSFAIQTDSLFFCFVFGFSSLWNRSKLNTKWMVVWHLETKRWLQSIDRSKIKSFIDCSKNYFIELDWHFEDPVRWLDPLLNGMRVLVVAWMRNGFNEERSKACCDQNKRWTGEYW